MPDLTRSIKCPNCQNDLWDILGDTASCSNCSTERPYHRQKPHSGQISPSQQKSITRIKRYFEQNWLFDDNKELAEAKVTFQDETGYAYLNINTDDFILTSVGGFFVIGRRGGIKLLHANTISKDKKSDAQHFAKMLGAKMGQ